MHGKQKTSDYFLPAEWFYTLGKIDKTDFKNMLNENPSLQTSEGFPVFAICAFWYNKYLQTKDIEINTQLEMQKDDSNDTLEKHMKQQTLIKLLISNMSKLAMFIPKSIAEGRMRRTLYAISSKVKTCINESTSILSKKYNLDYRQTLEILTAKYNEVIDDLHKSSKNISWADEVDAAVIQRKMLEAANVDPEVKKMVNNIYKDLDMSDIDDPNKLLSEISDEISLKEENENDPLVYEEEEEDYVSSDK